MYIHVYTYIKTKTKSYTILPAVDEAGCDGNVHRWNKQTRNYSCLFQKTFICAYIMIDVYI